MSLSGKNIAWSNPATRQRAHDLLMSGEPISAISLQLNQEFDDCFTYRMVYAWVESNHPEFITKRSMQPIKRPSFDPLPPAREGANKLRTVFLRKRKENELYETEAWATEALIRFFPVEGKRVWEPAAGNHKMADVLRKRGANVFTSDIQTYDRTHDATFDFLGGAVPHWPAGGDAIITNPPYGQGNRLAVKFAERALQHYSVFIALLLTAKFDSGKTRRHLFADNQRFVAKIVLLDRIQWFPGACTGTEDHAWYVWGPKPVVVTPPSLLYAERSA